jgi:GGDEF domain-containing protein
MRRHDILACETESRAWIIACNTAGSGAHALGQRIAEAVRETEPWRGAPLTVSVGIAVLGEDGSTSAELIDAADSARWEAAASGIEIVRVDSRSEE